MVVLISLISCLAMVGSSGTILLLSFIVCFVGAERDGRWFQREFKTVTRVVTEKQMVTENVPSSCVVVQTSLPPCRLLRSVNIQPSQPQRIMQTAAPVGMPAVNGQGWKPVLHPSHPVRSQSVEGAKTTPMPNVQTSSADSSWGWNFFNFRPREVYVTQTIREMYTTKHMDPNTVVTFSVKGCRPSRLPFDLPECQPPRAQTPLPESPEKGIIVMAPIQFVPSMVPLHTPAVKDTKNEEVIKEDKNEEVKTKEEEKKVEPLKAEEPKKETP